MAIETLEARTEPDWLIRDLMLATEAEQLAQDCHLDLLVGELRQLYPDATSATEALISICLAYDHDIREVASVMAEVLIDSQIVPVTIERFTPIADDTILPNHGDRHYRIGHSQTEELKIHLPDGWDPDNASSDELHRREYIAGDITVYLSTGLARQMGERSPVFVAEAGLSIKPFIDYEQALEAKAKALEAFDLQNDQAIQLANSHPTEAAYPTDEEIRQSHIRADFYRQLNQLRLGKTALQQA